MRYSRRAKKQHTSLAGKELRSHYVPARSGGARRPMKRDDEKSDLNDWLPMVDRLRYAPQWANEGPVPVEMTQTHISVVLLGRMRVLKLKKPVNFGFLDYTTLERRRLACEAEIRLNRRLCEQTYLKVQPIGQVDGSPQLSDSGEAIEYGVLMKRPPGEQMRGESVCVTDGICIFDCIEFNDRFRCCDVASEVAFLAMDLDSLGRPDLGYYFAERYQAHASDAHLFRLLPFYRCYRAYVRGKVL